MGRWLEGRSKGGEGGDLGDRPIGETSGRHKAKLPPTRPAKIILHKMRKSSFITA